MVNSAIHEYKYFKQLRMTHCRYLLLLLLNALETAAVLAGKAKVGTVVAFARVRIAVATKSNA